MLRPYIPKNDHFTMFSNTVSLKNILSRMKKQSLEYIFLILISLGALCFVLIGGLSIWADLEASLFGLI